MNKPTLRTCTVCKIEQQADLDHFHANGKRLRGECVRCWQFKNAALHANYRAKAYGRSERLTANDIRAIFAAANGLDYWTGAPLGEYWQIDHIIPMAHGGANSIENLCITNARTNRRKSSKVLSTWLAELAIEGYKHDLHKAHDLPVQIRMKL